MTDATTRPGGTIGFRTPIVAPALLAATAVGFINVFVFGIVAFSLHQMAGEYEERAESTARSQVQMLAQDIGREFEKIDITLLAAADEMERQLTRGGIDSESLNAFLARLQTRVPEVISMRATDANGIVLYGHHVAPAARLNNSDREFFVRQRNDPKAGLVISRPVMGRMDRQWVITISRSVRRLDGSFAGVVYVNVSVDHLSRVFASIDTGQRGSLSLRDAELRIFARHPVPTDPEKVFGQRLDVPELKALIASGRESGTYVSGHTVDGVKRRFAVHRVANVPLYIVLGRSTDETISRWKEEALKIMGLAAVFFLTTLASSSLVYRNWRRQVKAAMELAREDEKFHTVADFTYDWESWEGPNGELLYISPSCERITGYYPGEFLADPGLTHRLIHPEDAHLMQAHRESIAHVHEATVDFRIVRRDGEVRWIGHACQAVFGRDGALLGRRISNRDITERKQAESQLCELNNDFVTLLENTGGFIYFKHKDNRFRFCSRTMANITGHRSWRDMTGKDDFEVFPEETARIYREEEQPVFNEGKALLNKVDPYFDAQGELRWVNTNKWPVFDDKAAVVEIFGISRDVTELKAAEEKLNQLNHDLERRASEGTTQLEAANNELEAFAYSVSHDLRTPLRAIDGTARASLKAPASGLPSSNASSQGTAVGCGRRARSTRVRQYVFSSVVGSACKAE